MTLTAQRLKLIQRYLRLLVSLPQPHHNHCNWVAVRRTYVFTFQEVEKICRTLQSHVMLVWERSRTASCFKPQVAMFQLMSIAQKLPHDLNKVPLSSAEALVMNSNNYHLEALVRDSGSKGNMDKRRLSLGE